MSGQSGLEFSVPLPEVEGWLSPFLRSCLSSLASVQCSFSSHGVQICKFFTALVSIDHITFYVPGCLVLRVFPNLPMYGMTRLFYLSLVGS